MREAKEGVDPIDSPSGLDLNPQPPSPMRLSKRAGILGLGVVFVVAAAIGYGIYSRGGRVFQTGFHPDDSRQLTAATDAGKVIAAQIPNRAVSVAGTADRTASSPAELRAPEETPGRSSARSNGQRSAAASPYPSPTSPQPVVPTPEEKRLALAYERELQALDAPTGAHASGAAGYGRQAVPSGQVSELLRALQNLPPNGAPGGGGPKAMISGAHAQTNSSGDEYASQNMQDEKDRFVHRARAGSGETYLSSTRTKPFGRYEIKAGWDIPAVLEQALNSDLPGEIKALVRENVYDTATGRYILIPQGARLVGTYDSRVAYGQSGIQVVWNRLVFPDGSSIDLEGMAGQDERGFAGLRHDVDNHYKRLVGFGLLTSAFSAAFQLSQSRRGSVLGYPSASETAGSAIGGQISQLGADVTRRNLNIQPTVKVPVGYRFNVRVNRDIVFDAPYRAIPG
jgi:type IV secretory pathway VirB10-like protein